MSRYFSFLRKKRNPSLRDEETESFSSRTALRKKSGVRKSSTPHSQKLSHLSTSSASLSSQTGDENRHSTHSLDFFDLKQETGVDPFHSDSDSLLDNASVEGGDIYPVDEEKKVSEEVDFDNSILEGASEVFEKVGTIKRAVCSYVEEEDEGHVIEYYEDDEDNDNLIDDFMDEALYDLEENISTNVIVEEREQNSSCDDKSPEDTVSRHSSKNTEDGSSSFSTQKTSMESITHDSNNKFDQILHDDDDKVEGDEEDVKNVKVFTPNPEELDDIECVDAKRIDISAESPKIEVAVEVSPKETSHDALKANEIEIIMGEVSSNLDNNVGTLTLKHSNNNCTKDESNEHINLESSNSSREVLLTDVVLDESIFSANSINEYQSVYLIDYYKSGFPARNEEKAEDQLLTDIPTASVEQNELIFKDIDQKINSNLYDDSVLSVESSKLSSDMTEASVLAQESEKLSTDVTEAKQLDSEDTSLDTELKNYGDDEEGERGESVYESSKNGEEIPINLTSINNEIVIENVEHIPNNKSEDKIQINKIKHVENQEELHVINCNNIEDSHETDAATYSNNNNNDDNNNNNDGSVKADDEFIASPGNSTESNVLGTAVNVSSNNVSANDEICIKELVDELILGLSNTESKEQHFSSTPSSGQATDADDDDEFDSAKEDFSNEDDDSFNQRKVNSVIPVKSEIEDQHCPIITENSSDGVDKDIDVALLSDSQLISPPLDSHEEINTSHNDGKILTIIEKFADNEDENHIVSTSGESENLITSIPGESESLIVSTPGEPENLIVSTHGESENLIISTPGESENLIMSTSGESENVIVYTPGELENLVSTPGEPITLENGADQLNNEKSEAKTNLALEDICVNTESRDLILTDISETLSQLVSSGPPSKHLLLKRRNSSSIIEMDCYGNRLRLSTPDVSSLRSIEGEERQFRKFNSQPDDRELMFQEPSKKIQSVTEDSFLLTTVNADHQKAEAKLAQRRAARAEARELRLRELEKQQQKEHQENNEEEEQYAASSFTHDTPVSRTPSTPRTRSSVPVNSLSRMDSEDSIPDDHLLPSSARELKADLQELEEKFRKAMVLNAQLDNEKATLMYEVEFLKDKYADLEEAHIQLTKEHKKKSSENEQLRKLSNKLKEEVKMVRRVLQERDELIQEYGLVLIGEENGEESYDDMEDEERTSDTIMDLSPRKIGVKKALLSQEASELLSKGAAKGSLDVRLRKYAEDKHELEDEVRRLKLVLEEELNNKRRENGLDYEKHKETTKSLNEFKFKIQKAEAEVSTLQANVARLESLVTRYKTSTEELEKSEEELKSEKRRLQRELREVKERCDELETSKAYVKRQYEKLLHERGRV